MTGPSYLCDLGLHWRCPGTCYPIGLPARPCECGLCRHKNAAPAVAKPPIPPRAARPAAGAAHKPGGAR